MIGDVPLGHEHEYEESYLCAECGHPAADCICLRCDNDHCQRQMNEPTETGFCEECERKFNRNDSEQLSKIAA